MPQHLRRRRPAPDEVRRLLAGLNSRALRLLEAWELEPVGRIHRARQAFKRIRAVLRLIEPAAPYVFRVENRFFRDCGRRLSGARDATAIVEAVCRLEGDVWESGPRESLLMLKAGLQRRAQRHLDSAVADIDGEVETVCAELRESARRLQGLPLPGLRRRDLRGGARKTFRRAGGHFETAWATAAPDALHDWRKHVKYAYYQTGFMEELMPGWSARRRPALYELSDLLGHVQDLAVLDELLGHQPDDLGIDTHLQSLHALIRRAQRDSRAQALALGAQLFGRPDRPMAGLPVARGLAAGQ